MTEAISLKDVYDELKRIEKNMVTKEEVGELLETVAILGNTETMQQLAGSKRDIQLKRTNKINSAANLF